MGLFNFFNFTDINQEIENMKAVEGAVLIDVRTKEEYESGHIPGSNNVPVDEIDKVTDVIKDFNTPVYAYCRSGARSSRAVKKMKELGYNNVKNIGGISNYKGQKEI